MSSKEQDIKDAFSLIGFKGRKNDFVRLHKHHLQKISPTSDLTYATIIFASDLQAIENKFNITEAEIEEVKFGFKKFKKSINESVNRYNDRYRTKLFVLFKKVDNLYTAHFNTTRPANFQLIRKSKFNPKVI